jgi:hypothetical protein
MRPAVHAGHFAGARYVTVVRSAHAEPSRGGAGFRRAASKQRHERCLMLDIMQTPRSFSRSLVLVALMPLSAATGCGPREQMMAASGHTPAAQGTVSAEKGDNGNTVARVRVKHLAPPSRLASDATTYVVWLKAGHDPIRNVGALTIDDDLTGEIEFMTPHEIFRVTVTPESTPTTTAPMHAPVFSANVDSR